MLSKISQTQRQDIFFKYMESRFFKIYGILKKKKKPTECREDPTTPLSCSSGARADPYLQCMLVQPYRRVGDMEQGTTHLCHQQGPEESGK